MRLSLKATGLLVTVALAIPTLHSQEKIAKEFRKYRDDDGDVVAVDYYGTSGLRSSQLHQLPKLESLTIVYGTHLTTGDVSYLSTLSDVVDLRIGQELVDSLVTIEGDLSKLVSMKSLESILICKDEIKDDDLKFVASLPRIVDLEFNADTGLWGDGASVLTDRCGDYVRSATTLESIRVQGHGHLSDEFVSKLSSGLANLKDLDLSSPKLTDESLRLLASRCTKLRSLNLGSDKFTDKGVLYLADNASSLERLGLYSDSLTEKSLALVAKFPRMKHLELTVPKVSPKGLQAVARLRQLEILALREPTVTDAQFALLENHPSLKYVYVNGVGLSEGQVLKTIGKLPELCHLGVGAKNKRLQLAVNRALRLRDRSTNNKSSDNTSGL